MKKALQWFGIVVLRYVSGAFLLASYLRREHPTKCSLIHAPKSGCPQGWKLKPRFFTEGDGSHLDACESDDPTLQPCIDQIRPKEEVHVVIEIPYGKEQEQAPVANDATKKL